MSSRIAENEQALLHFSGSLLAPTIAAAFAVQYHVEQSGLKASGRWLTQKSARTCRPLASGADLPAGARNRIDVQYAKGEQALESSE
jgi:hypothetical protein